MAISVQQARRKEYPEMGEDVRMVSEKDEASGKFKTKQVRVPVKLTNTFWFTYRNPNTQKYERQALTYGQNKTRIMPVDIRNWESEIGIMPALVQRELNYKVDPIKKMWVDIVGSKNSPDCYEDCTEEYFDYFRPDAYLNQEDPFKGMKRPKQINVIEFRLHLMERKYALMEAKERNLVIPIVQHDTLTGEQKGMTKGQFEAPIEGTPVATSDVPQFIEEH